MDSLNAIARENGCDFVVALGGGNVIDAGKAIAFMATNGGDYWDYIGSGTGKGKAFDTRPLLIVAITTTGKCQGCQGDGGLTRVKPPSP